MSDLRIEIDPPGSLDGPNCRYILFPLLWEGAIDTPALTDALTAACGPGELVGGVWRKDVADTPVIVTGPAGAGREEHKR